MTVALIVELLRIYGKIYKVHDCMNSSSIYCLSFYFYFQKKKKNSITPCFVGGRDVKEPIFETRWMLPTIARDLLTLENQLPLFVLQRIFELTTFKGKVTPLNKLALQFFEPLISDLGKKNCQKIY